MASKNVFFCFLFLSTFFACRTETVQQTKPIIQGEMADSAMVVTAHPLASDIGVSVLKKGGNAFDAALAVHFALAVVNPRAGNIGGGGFALFRSFEGQTGSLDFREMAPQIASRDMYLQADGSVIANMSTKGTWAVGVPGSVDGIFALHGKYGSLPAANLIAPAEQIARLGFPISESEAERLNKFQADFKTYNQHENAFVKSAPWSAGDTLLQVDLANTLQRIMEYGPSEFYEGKTASLLLREMEKNEGPISAADLKAYKSVWREPISCAYHSFTVHSMAPPSSGGIAVCQILQGLQTRDLASLGFHTPGAIHLVAELEKRAFADRAKYLGDPDFVQIPMDTLLHVDYLNDKFSDFNPQEASSYEAFLADSIIFQEVYETTHYSIVDPEGNAVSITTTLNGNYGSKVIVEGAGFFLNNEMDDFSVKPGVPNQFGLVGAEANAIQAGKRMLSSMTPTIVEKNGALFMVLGGPGGPTIITSVLQCFLNVADFKMSMQEAVDAGRFHHQWIPDYIQYEEGRYPQKVLEVLQAKGHQLKEVKKLGKMEAILRYKDGQLEGAADSLRGKDDRAMGF